jgi:hypothetical protein
MVFDGMLNQSKQKKRSTIDVHSCRKKIVARAM